MTRWTFALLLVISAPRLAAVEKYWMAHEATVIVIGTFRPNPTVPWFDGWHVTGTIDVEEVLFGANAKRELHYRYVCPYAMCNDLRARPWTMHRYLAQKGIWFLKPLDAQRWQPSAVYGFDGLSRRADYEEYICVNKY